MLAMKEMEFEQFMWVKGQLDDLRERVRRMTDGGGLPGG